MSNTDFDPADFAAYKEQSAPTTSAPPTASTAPTSATPAAPADDQFDPNEFQQYKQQSGNMFSDVWPEIKKAVSENVGTIEAGLGPSSTEQTIQESKDRPFWDITPQLHSLARTGSALTAIPALAAAPITGATRSLLGHPLATASEALGLNIDTNKFKSLIDAGTPEKEAYEQSKLNPDQTYEQWKGNVDTAMMGLRPKGVTPAGVTTSLPPPTPPVPTALAPANRPFGITLSQGEAESDLAKRMAEQNAIRSGDPHARTWYDQRVNEIQQANQNLLKGLDPYGQTIAQTPQEAGELVSQGVQSAAAANKTGVDNLYQLARSMPGEIHAAAFEGLPQKIKGDLTLRDEPVFIDENTPNAAKMINYLDNKIGALKITNLADPFGPPNPENIVGVSLKGVDQWRKALSTMRSDAYGSANGADQRATRAVLDSFDDHIDQAVNGGLFNGNPAAVEAWNNARAAYSDYRSTFGGQGTKDPVGRVVNKILGDNINDPITPTKVVDQLVGSTGVSPSSLNIAVVKRIKSILGEQSPEWVAAKQGVLSRLIQTGEGEQGLGTGQVAQRLSKFLNSDIAEHVYSPQELATLRSYANLMRQISMPPGTYFPSAPGIGKYISMASYRVGQLLGAIVGSHIPFIPRIVGEFAGITIGGKLEKAAEAWHNNIRSQLPIVATEMKKWQRAQARAQSAPSWATRQGAVLATNNLQNALSPLGINLRQLQMPGTGTAAPQQDEHGQHPSMTAPAYQNIVDGLSYGSSQKIPEGYAVNDAGEIFNKQTGEVLQPTKVANTSNTRSPQDKLLGIGGERYQLWPERMVRSAVTLPGDVYSGKEPITDPATGHTSENVIQRAQDLAGFAGGASMPAAERGALGMSGGALKIPTALETLVADKPQLSADVQHFLQLAQPLEAKYGANWPTKLSPQELQTIRSNPAYTNAILTIQKAQDSGLFDKVLNTQMTRRDVFGTAARAASLVANASRLGKVLESFPEQTAPQLVAPKLLRDPNKVLRTARDLADNSMFSQFVQSSAGQKALAQGKTGLDTAFDKYTQTKNYQTTRDNLADSWLKKNYGHTIDSINRDLEMKEASEPVEYEPKGFGDWYSVEEMLEHMNQDVGDRIHDKFLQVVKKTPEGKQALKNNKQDDLLELADEFGETAEADTIRNKEYARWLKDQGFNRSDISKLLSGKVDYFEDLYPPHEGVYTVEKGDNGYGVLDPFDEGEIHNYINKEAAEAKAANLTAAYKHWKNSLYTDTGRVGAPLSALEHNQYGLYSPVERAAANAPQSKMQASQWYGWLKNNTSLKVPVLRLTPKLKEQALSKGLPMFKKGGVVSVSNKDKQSIEWPPAQKQDDGKVQQKQEITERAKGGALHLSHPWHPNNLAVLRERASGGRVEHHKKIDRSAFLYLKGNNENFAQCGSCSLMAPDKTCVIFNSKVKDEWSCGLYVPGPYKETKSAALVTPEEAGLVKYQVRCENCTYGGEHCQLYTKLNKQFPDLFDLDTKIDSQACCNAFIPHEPIKRAHGGRVEAANVNHQPTEGQKRAGNYAKDHVSVHGLNITIENAKGMERKGVGKDGKPWRVVMPSAYGYLKGTEGKDSDHLDIYLGHHKNSPNVYIVDQHDADSKRFDEHKIFLGFGSLRQVVSTYERAFSDNRGLERIGKIAMMTVPEFKHWLEHGDTKKPFEPSWSEKKTLH